MSPLSFHASYWLRSHSPSIFFFFNDTATTEIYTLSLHDALPIFTQPDGLAILWTGSTIPDAILASVSAAVGIIALVAVSLDRKSTRLNSSHSQISYAVFCLKKKKKTIVYVRRCNEARLYT